VTVLALTVLAGTGVWRSSAPGPEQPLELTPTPPLSEQPLELALTPTLSDRLGVASSSTFALTANRPLDPAAVRAGLSVEPAVELSVVAEDGRLLLVPSGALKQDETYRFSLALDGRSFSWAFTTPAPFRVLDTLPRHITFSVPLDTRIEIRFSQDFEPSADYFVIGPRELHGETRGRFEVGGNVWAFVPDALEPSSVYLITVKAGLRVRDSHLTLDRDFTFQFSTVERTDTPGAAFTASGPFEFATTDAPVLRSFNSPPHLAKEYEVAVFSYPDASAFMNALAAQPSSLQAPASPQATDHLVRVASFRVTPERRPGFFGASLALTGPLPAGFYLAELRASPSRTTQQVHFQVTDISYYVSVTATQTLLWLNDLSTKRPLAQAQLETGAQRVAVGPDGVVVLPTAIEQGRVHSGYRVTAPGKEAVVFISQAFPAWQGADRYRRYLYLDRSIYRPDDTVRFWGVLAARESGAAPVDRVRVSVGRPEGAGLVEVSVPVRDSTFAGEMTLPGLPPGDYQLKATGGGVQVGLGRVKVETFAKPTHTLEVTANPRVAVAGDDIDVRARVIRSDGTPVADVPITFEFAPAAFFDVSGPPPIQAVATTDARGEATFRQTVPTGGARIVDVSRGFNFEWFRVNVRARTGAGELANSVWLPIFPSRAHVSATSTLTDGLGEVRFLVRELSLARVNRGESGPEPDIYLGRTLADRPLTVTLIRELDSVSLGEVTLRTDASGQARYSFAVEPDKSYLVSVTALDDAQRSTTRSVRVSGPAYPEPPSQRWLGTAGRTSWKIGETVELRFLLRDNKTPPPRPQAFLFYTYGLDRHEVRSDPVFRFTFREEDVPAAQARGVYFDGRAYQMTRDLVCGSIFQPTTPVRADTAARELSVTVRPDRPDYRPGDTVRLEIDVRDRAGRPVRANVNLSVGDGASPPLQRQELDGGPPYLARDIATQTSGLIQRLDPQVPPEFASYASHSEPEFIGGGCEGGYGLGTPTLQDPRITAFFRSLTTDADGRATASFTLPDDRTDWLLTYHAVTPRMESARGVVDLRVRQP